MNTPKSCTHKGSNRIFAAPIPLTLTSHIPDSSWSWPILLFSYRFSHQMWAGVHVSTLKCHWHICMHAVLTMEGRFMHEYKGQSTAPQCKAENTWKRYVGGTRGVDGWAGGRGGGRDWASHSERAFSSCFYFLVWCVWLLELADASLIFLRTC